MEDKVAGYEVKLEIEKLNKEKIVVIKKGAAKEDKKANHWHMCFVMTKTR